MHKDISSVSLITDYQPLPSAMKKYYQLALVIISLVSVVTLLFYRHEYNRLRYVLEVLNFFGKPGGQQSGSTSDDCITRNSSPVKRFLSFGDPLPTWQRVSSTHFVYSAYWELSEEGRGVRAVSVEFGDSIPNFGCSFWFEDKDASVLGTFGFSQIAMKEAVNEVSGVINKPKISGYYLLCRTKDVINVPYGVTFYKIDDTVPSKAFIPVHYTNEKLPLSNSTAVCITASLTPGIPQSTIAEFFGYYQLVGIKNYVIYNGGLPSKVLSFLQSTSVHEGFGLDVSVLPWNFPFASLQTEAVARMLMEKDCLLRTMGKVNDVAVLTWEEYIVPRYHHLLASMLDDFDSGKKATSRFEIPCITFCVEFPDDERAEAASPLIVRKTRYRKVGDRESSFYVYHPHLLSFNNRELAATTQHVSQGIAAVHRYVHCFQSGVPHAEQEYLNEPAMQRFSGDLKKSKLFKAWSSGKLFI